MKGYQNFIVEKGLNPQWFRQLDRWDNEKEVEYNNGYDVWELH